MGSDKNIFMNTPASGLDLLVEYGFSHLTGWELRLGKCKLATTDWDLVSGWIYAFVTGSCARYIGIATTVLRSRLDGYSYQLNDSVGGYILDHLSKGIAVEIFGVQRCGISKVDLELEESRLIRTFQPDWNTRR